MMGLSSPTMLRVAYAALLTLGVVSSITVIPVPVNLILTSALIIYIGSYRALREDVRGMDELVFGCVWSLVALQWVSRICCTLHDLWAGK